MGLTAGATSLSAQTAPVLPPPETRGAVPLEEALARRRSVREFGRAALTPAQLGQLCWAAQGVTGRGGLRTAPSAGALYPLELYVVTADGVLHYHPASHQVSLHRPGDLRKALQAAALGQDAVGDAPAVFVLAAVYQRTAARYGEGRARRYAQLEAGHAAQNLLLQAVALGLGAVPVGAFDDGRVQHELGLPADQEPLYLVPTGGPPT
jgi:SagB-type dehydrogenase family enzyme